MNNNSESSDCAGDQIDANLAVEQQLHNQTSEHFPPNIPVKNSLMAVNVEKLIQQSMNPQSVSLVKHFSHQSENAKRAKNLTTTRNDEQNPNRAQNSPRPTKCDKQKHTVAILGHSMIKNINKKRLQNAWPKLQYQVKNISWGYSC